MWNFVAFCLPFLAICLLMWFMLAESWREKTIIRPLQIDHRKAHVGIRRRRDRKMQFRRLFPHFCTIMLCNSLWVVYFCIDAAFQALGQVSPPAIVAVIIPAANLSGLYHLIGYFFNTLLLRNDRFKQVIAEQEGEDEDSSQKQRTHGEGSEHDRKKKKKLLLLRIIEQIQKRRERGGGHDSGLHRTESATGLRSLPTVGRLGTSLGGLPLLSSGKTPKRKKLWSKVAVMSKMNSLAALQQHQNRRMMAESFSDTESIEGPSSPLPLYSRHQSRIFASNNGDGGGGGGGGGSNGSSNNNGSQHSHSPSLSSLENPMEFFYDSDSAAAVAFPTASSSSFLRAAAMNSPSPSTWKKSHQRNNGQLSTEGSSTPHNPLSSSANNVSKKGIAANSPPTSPGRILVFMKSKKISPREGGAEEGKASQINKE